MHCWVDCCHDETEREGRGSCKCDEEGKVTIEDWVSRNGYGDSCLEETAMGRKSS